MVPAEDRTPKSGDRTIALRYIAESRQERELGRPSDNDS
jgi:hypothetical protein